MRKLLWLLAVLAAPALGGLLYQKFGTWTDRRRYARIGRMVRTAMTSVYVNELGPTGATAPTVIFESGIGATSQNWLRLQREVARQVRTISYDRPGLGWSLPTNSAPTPQILASGLRSLLTAAQIPGPYMMVGHSFGGLVGRQFAADYPDEVLGLVLVDPMRPEDWPPLNDAGEASLARSMKLATAGMLLARFGITRLFMRSTLMSSGRLASLLCRIGGEAAQTLMDRMLCEVGKMPPEAKPAVVANWSRPEFYRTLRAYLRSVPATVTAMHSAAPLTMPVIVLTPVTATPLTEAQLQAISSNARQVIAQESAHWVHLDEPAIVLSAIRDILASIKPNQQAQAVC
jgi:pimeloyl-ACP methyl ester carboxylesterase